ncbi:MAG TPA: DeoR/GlpR family DNA-binding transcription regulator [Rectinemataceae bacterium]|nr:DeoR/GlpR family DNA-binding transcription regulator [Rectinemataceae bacterium]
MIEELAERERSILKTLTEQGSLSVSALARDLGVSEVTVRSDLKALEERGYLSRSRGGAYPALHQSILERQSQRIVEKNRIAKAAAELVCDGDRIMIEAGTTTALIVRYLIGKRDVQVVTNSTLVFSYARLNPNLQITLTGGEFRRETESMVGPIALRTIAGLNVRLAFVGTDGFSASIGMTTQLVEGAEIVKAMRDKAEATWLVADSSKYGKTGFVSVLSLESIHGIIIDEGLGEDAMRDIVGTGLSVVRV